MSEGDEFSSSNNSYNSAAVTNYTTHKIDLEGKSPWGFRILDLNSNELNNNSLSLSTLSTPSSLSPNNEQTTNRSPKNKQDIITNNKVFPSSIIVSKVSKHF